MTFLLYATTAAALLWLCHRHVRPISRPAAALLFLLPFCFVGYALVSNRAYGPFDFAYATEPLQSMRAKYGVPADYNGILSDVACQMIPWRKAVQWSIAHREWPLLNRFILSGDILAAAAQPAAYSPFTLIACLLPVSLSMTYSAAIAFFIAAAGTFLFAREIGCGESAALFAGAAWMYSTNMAVFIEWPLAFSWAFLPLVLLGVRRVVRAPQLDNVALLAATFVLLLLAGHPETALHVVAIGALYYLFETILHRRNVLRSLSGGTAAGVLAMLVCAIYVLPVIDAARQTVERAFRIEYYSQSKLGLPARDVLVRLATDLFPFLHARDWLIPGVTPPAADSAAVGSIALAAAAFALRRARSVHVWFLAALATVCLLARAEWPPLLNALQHLPLFDIALNERFSFAASFALAVLGGLGVEELLRERRMNAAVTFAATLVALAGGTVLILRARMVGPNLNSWGDYKIFAEFAFLSLATLVILPRFRNRYTAGALIALLLLQRTMSESGFYRTFSQEVAYPAVPIFEPLRRLREPFRVAGLQMMFIPGTSALYEMEDPRGYEAMTLERYAETYRLWSTPQPVWFNRIDDFSKPFLSFLNVRFGVIGQRDPLPDGWREVATQPGSRLVENSRALGRAFVPRHVRLGVTIPDALNEMSAQKDFGEQAWIHTPSGRPHERDNGPGTVTVRRRRLGYGLAINMQRAGWVVVSEAGWKGWRAYLDERRVQVQIANTAFLAVYVPAGQHSVRLVYLPQSFLVGRLISFATLGASILFAAVHATRRRRVTPGTAALAERGAAPDAGNALRRSQ